MDAGIALKIFNEDVGMPDEIVVDRSMEQTTLGSDFIKQCQFTNTHIHVTNPYTPNQNLAEGMIRVLKKRWKIK